MKYLIVASWCHVAAAPPRVPEVFVGGTDLGRQRHVRLELGFLSVGRLRWIDRLYFGSVYMLRYPNWSSVGRNRYG